MRRQRPDGTWTFTTEDWDRAWYWPEGTRVGLADGRRGVVTKQNTISVSVRLEDGGERLRVPMKALRRLDGGQ